MGGITGIAGQDSVAILGNGKTVYLRGLDVNGIGVADVGISVGTSKVTIQDSVIRNSNYGVKITGSAGARAYIIDSVITSNQRGVFVGGNFAPMAAILIRTIVDNHPVYATSVEAPSVLVLDGSKLTGSAVSILNENSSNGRGTVTSLGNNYINGSGAPTLNVQQNSMLLMSRRRTVRPFGIVQAPRSLLCQNGPPG